VLNWKYNSDVDRQPFAGESKVKHGQNTISLDRDIVVKNVKVLHGQYISSADR